MSCGNKIVLFCFIYLTNLWKANRLIKNIFIKYLDCMYRIKF